MSVVVTIEFKGQPVTLTTQEARHLYFQLEELLYPKSPATRIKTVVAKHFEISPLAIDSRKRSALILRARWLSIALAKDTMSIPQIAAAFDKNVSTIQNALSKIYDRLQAEPSFAADLVLLRRKLKETTPL